jgi:hypothetical protein
MFFVKCHKNTTKNIQKSQTKENYNIVTAWMAIGDEILNTWLFEEMVENRSQTSIHGLCQYLDIFRLPITVALLNCCILALSGYFLGLKVRTGKGCVFPLIIFWYFSVKLNIWTNEFAYLQTLAHCSAQGFYCNDKRPFNSLKRLTLYKFLR